MQERLIEEALLNSWPAHQQMLFDGWIVRFGKGYTKRANSVVPLYNAFLPAQEKISLCERYYKEQHLPTIFRLPSFPEGTPELEALLVQRDYQLVDLTHVLYKPLLPVEAKEPVAGEAHPVLHEATLEDWMQHFYQFHQQRSSGRQLHRELLERIVQKPLFAVLHDQGRPVACGLGVLENEVFGMFDIVTSPQERRQGYGAKLVETMLAWARERGVSHAYLQVISSNEIAHSLYKKLGFQELYRYWYRVKQQPDA